VERAETERLVRGAIEIRYLLDEDEARTVAGG